MTRVNVKATSINKINGCRVKVTLRAAAGSVINYQYHHQILGLIYNFLKSSDPDYAAWLHEQGYYVSAKTPLFVKEGSGEIFEQSHKNFKLFCVSGIRFHCKIRTTGRGFAAEYPRDELKFSIQISSPVTNFIQHLIIGLFERENCLYIGQIAAFVETVESLPELIRHCEERSDAAISLKPLASPIFIKKPMPYGERDKYLFPEDPEFNGYLNKNLRDKWTALFSGTCPYDDLEFTFYNNDAHFKGRNGTAEQSQRQSKKSEEMVIEIPNRSSGKPNKIKGTLKRFKVAGHPELIKLGLYAGFGANNAIGCGYCEVKANA